MRLTIKSIIRWEQLTQKPFSQLDYTLENDIISLFYTCSISEGNQLSLEEFTESIDEHAIKKMVADFEKQTSIIAQFQSASDTNGHNERIPSAPVFIKDIIATLIMAGLDVYYAMNDMELCDLPIFTQAYEQKNRDNLITQRLWVFLTLQPHLKRGTKPEDIYPFTWELEEKTLTEKEIEAGRNEFQTFLQTGLKK